MVGLEGQMLPLAQESSPEWRVRELEQHPRSLHYCLLGLLRAVLCVVGCLAESLAFAQELPKRPPLNPSCDN